MNISIENLLKRFDTIKSNRSQWESLWQDCADYCLPQKAIITQSRTPGTKLKTDIYDSTAIQSTQVLAAGLHSYLTNPTSRWFALEMKDKALMDVFEVKVWLKNCEDAIFDYLNTSNFNQIIHEDYINFSTFGTSTLYEEPDFEDTIAFFARPTSEIFILANDKGRIDTVYRHFTYTARQAHQKWGDNAGEKVVGYMNAGKVEEVIPFLQIVLPREERDIRKRDAINMPFASLYVEPKTQKILSEGGYEEFPFFISRFYKVSDSEYAYSPASMAISDIKMINAMSKTNIKGAQKAIDPPLVLPHDGYLLPFKTTPGAINYKLSGQPDDKVETLGIPRDFSISLEMENQRRESIKRAFFVDLFLLLAQEPKMTATEVMQRVNEKMLILGPVLGRLMYEKLDPIIVRTFAILAREGKLPLPPQIVMDSDSEYKVKYISPLAKAQRASESKSIVDLVLAVKEMAEIDTSVVDNIDFDKTTKELAETYNTPSEILRSDEEIVEIRQQRAQTEQMQREAELLKTAAPGVKAAVEAEEIISKPKGGEVVAGKS